MTVTEYVDAAVRAAGCILDLPATIEPRPIARVAVIGGGTMGCGIAMNFLNAGFRVTLLEPLQPALDKGRTAIRQSYLGQVERGKLTPDDYQMRMDRLSETLDYAALNTTDLAIEALFEDLKVKQDVFCRLDAVLRPGAILASNTSTLDIDRIASVTGRPGDVVGLHFFSPAHVMKLLEIVRGAHTAPDVIATAAALAPRIGKVAVVSRVCDGFIGNRMMEQYVRQASFLVEEGASPQQVDRAIEAFGVAMGPFRVGDLVGNDIGWAIRQRRYIDKPHVRYSKLGDLLYELGRHGQKSGAGWYDYMPGQRQPVASPQVDAMTMHTAEHPVF